MIVNKRYVEARYRNAAMDKGILTAYALAVALTPWVEPTGEEPLPARGSV